MSAFPDILRHWRQTRRLSQLDLAHEANVSARHISFLETGRSRPSRDMILMLGEALSIPLSDRNHMLTATGFAPRFTEHGWQDAELAPIQKAIARTLDRHAPYPGVAIDKLWHLTQMNEPARVMFGLLGLAPGASLLDFLKGPLAPQIIENWPEVALHSLRRLRTESAALGGVPALEETASYLADHAQPAGQPSPLVPTIFNLDGQRFSTFGTIAQFGTPEDATLSEMKIELIFPADPETEAKLHAMFGGDQGS